MNPFPVRYLSDELNALLGELGYVYDPEKDWVVASPYRFRFSSAGKAIKVGDVAYKRVTVCRVTVIPPHLESGYGVVFSAADLMDYFRTMEGLGADALLRTKRLTALLADD